MTEETSGSTGGALTINQGQDLVFTWDSRSGAVPSWKPSQWK
jgi:hypothetical protein